MWATYAILNFPVATWKEDKVKLILTKFFNSIRVYPKYCHLEHVISIKVIDTFYILFVVWSLLNLLCISNSQHLSIQTNWISSAQKPHLTSGYLLGHQRLHAFKLSSPSHINACLAQSLPPPDTGKWTGQPELGIRGFLLSGRSTGSCSLFHNIKSYRSPPQA